MLGLNKVVIELYISILPAHDVIHHHSNLAEEASHSSWDHQHGPHSECLTLPSFEIYFPLITGGIDCVFCQDETDNHNWDCNLMRPVKRDVKIQSRLEVVEDSRE